MTIAIVLGRSAVDSRVLIDGNDVTASVIGVEVRAFIGEASHVTLTLSSRVEITGESSVSFKGLDRMVSLRDKFPPEAPGAA
jgi:hypothetical protein